MGYPRRPTAAPPLSDRLALLWLRATLAACAEGPLPPALGTTLHGATGRALKLSACAFKDPEHRSCVDCPMLDTCPYPRLFEPQHGHRGGSVPPPALLIAPAAATPTHVRPGTPMVIDFGLIGRGVHALPLLLAALRVVVEAGLGPRRLPCTVVRVDALTADGRPAHAVQVGASLSGSLPPPITAHAWYAAAEQAVTGRSAVHLQVRTRLRLQREGVVESTPPGFGDLIRALVRRADALARAYCGEDAPFPDPRPWLQAAAEVQLADTRLHWRPHSRFSASTKSTMRLDGFLGKLMYVTPTADLAPFLPLLHLGEAIGVGRGCSFGNGRYRLEIVAAESQDRRQINPDGEGEAG